MSDAKIVRNYKQQKQLDYALRIYKKKPEMFIGIKSLRKGASLRGASMQMKKEYPNACTSSSTIATRKKGCSLMIANNELFKEFADLIGRKDEATSKIKGLEKKKITGFDVTKKRKDKLQEELAKANIILAEISNPDITESEKWRLSNTGRRQVDRINESIKESGIAKIDGINQLYDINGKLLAKGKNIILTNLDKINVKHFGDLKALSDILDTAFKQNRLIEGKSTENVAVGVHDIYDKIIANSDKQNVNQNPDKIITQED